MKKEITQQLICVGIVAVLLGTALVLQALRPKDTQPTPDSQSTVSTNPSGGDIQPPEQDDYQREVALRQPDGQVMLSCDDVGFYSGPFMEDGSDREVEGVASVLVTNRSGQYLDRAELTYEVDGRLARFIVAGLHPGRSAWVLEANALAAGEESKYIYIEGTASYLDGVEPTTPEITVSSVEGRLRVVNNTDRTLENVIIYYKNLHEDGAYLGGITYAVGFGTLAPGGAVEKLAGQYGADSQIVRVEW